MGKRRGRFGYGRSSFMFTPLQDAQIEEAERGECAATTVPTASWRSSSR